MAAGKAPGIHHEPALLFPHGHGHWPQVCLQQLLWGAGGFCLQETFKREGKGMNRTSITAAGLEVANDIRLPPLQPILRSPHPGEAPLLV